MKHWPLLAVFIITWVSVAVIRLPATLLLSGLGLPVNAGAVTGSVWQGSADQMLLGTPAGSVALGKVSWTLQPAALWRGQACLAITTELEAQQASGEVCVDVRGGILVRDLLVNLPLNGWSNSLALPMQGELALQVTNLHVGQSGLLALEARGSLAGASVHDGRQWLPLPNLALEAQASHNDEPAATRHGIHLRFRDQLSVLGEEQGQAHGKDESNEPTLALDIESRIDPQGNYRTWGSIVTTPQTPLSLSRYLPVIADFAANSAGQRRYTIDWAGVLDADPGGSS
ncbi:MAG: type II secretion system protein N [Pseudohongiellaceae bacterium]